jgi:UDP-N-acetylmuramoylalanine--D-glutamate ligase
MNLEDLKKKQRIAILWYGLEGQSTYRFLRAQGIANETITILDKTTTLSTPSGVKTRLWTDYLEGLEAYDCVFRAPGITTTIIQTTLWKKIATSTFTSQTEFLLNNYTGTIIGITWTKGKSTISTLTALTLQQAGKKTILAGNIGKPVLDLIDRENLPEIVVYEFSSFMIESLFTKRTGRKIDIAVFNTIYNTHTKEHGGYENYVKAKLLLLKHSHQQLIWAQAAETIHAQFPHIDLPQKAELYGKAGKYNRDGKMFYLNDTPLFDDKNMLLIGNHNRENACAIIGICDLLQIDYNYLSEVLKSFHWLEHRLELVGTYRDIIRYNDAIATTPEATCAALDSFGNEVDTLFYGGIQGEYNHHLVAKKIMHYGISNLVLFPDTGEILFNLLDEETKKSIQILLTRSMTEAVQRAAKHTKPWKIALLSCGSPSFSVWSWFIEKGTLFKEAVREV